MNTTPEDDSSSLAATRDDRRWLIGVGISVAFGLFGVVMALLSYFDRASPAAPSGINMPAKRGAEPTPTKRERWRSERHK